MSDNFNSGNRGASIIPSARSSIHSHQVKSSSATMGTYGANKKQKSAEPQCGSSTSFDHGRDEVDNVQSKFTRASSPIAARRTAPYKRRSFDASYTSEDSSNDDKFQKFASLPPYLYCSEDIQLDHSDFRNTSNNSIRSANSHHSQYDRSLSEKSLNTSSSSLHSILNQENGIDRSNMWLYIIIVSLIVIILSYYLYGYKEQTLLRKQFDQERFINHLKSIGAQYKINEDSILKLETGVTTILKRQDAGSFIFIYKSDTNKYNPTEFNNFINAIASTTSRFLRNESTFVEHIDVDGSKLEMRNHGELISKYREEFDKCGVMLVRQLEDVPAKLAMAFHYYCDEYDPLVKKSAMFFTLDMAKCSYTKKDSSPHVDVEKCLAKKWSGLPNEYITPLLARVVNVIIDVNQG